jgi:AcrR family transcriptional regulator
MATRTSPAPWRRRYTEDELLDAALATFDAGGYQSAQITDIAEAAGTTKPTLYARLGSKEQIYLRLVEREADQFKTGLADAYQQAAALPLSGVVSLAVRAFFDFARERQTSFDLLFRSEPGRPGPEIGKRAVDEVIDSITELMAVVVLRAGRQPGKSVGLLAAATAGVATQTCLYALDHGQDLGDAEMLAAGYIEAAMRQIDRGMLAAIDNA